MIPYTFDMPTKTHATMVGWVSKWRAILRVPGTKLFPPAVRKEAVLELYEDHEIRRFIRDAEVALSKFEIKSKKATISLLHLTENQKKQNIVHFGIVQLRRKLFGAGVFVRERI